MSFLARRVLTRPAAFRAGRGMRAQRAFSSGDSLTPEASSESFIALENRYGASNYAPLPVVLSRGLGARVWDVEGRPYYDWLSAYSAVNQGHCHPRLLSALVSQSSRLTLTSRAFFNDRLGPWEELMCQTFGYQRALPMNTGAEATETALKLVRRWGYDVKGTPPDRAVVVYACGSFHGRTMGAISASDDPESRGGFGPLLPGIVRVPYGDIQALRQLLDSTPHVVGVVLEPIQGEAGIVVPPEGYLPGVAQLCREHGALFVADEIQTGLGRTGRMLACDHEGVKPDVLVLGKALSGGVLPASAVLSSSEVMLTIKPGQHGSTYGGNPLACAVSEEAVKVVLEEGLAQAAEERGREVRAGLQALVESHPTMLAGVRGRGLLNALVVRQDARDGTGRPISAHDICMALLRAAELHDAPWGILAKPTHGHIIRLAPPLVISAAETRECLGVMAAAVARLDKGMR